MTIKSIKNSKNYFYLRSFVRKDYKTGLEILCRINLQYGRVCWSEEVKTIDKKYNLKIIEDNAQAVGVYYFVNDGMRKRTSSLDDAAGNCFYPGKNLGVLRDSGAVTINKNVPAVAVRALAICSSQEKYVNRYQGLNSRMDEITGIFSRKRCANVDSLSVPPHKQMAYAEWNNRSFPVTEQIHNEALSLPMSPVLERDEIKQIVDLLNKKSI
jgi:dTDP-4-amino-4,6-dideoxygalactose transaminase